MHNVMLGFGLKAQYKAADGEAGGSRCERLEEGVPGVSHEQSQRHSQGRTFIATSTVLFMQSLVKRTPIVNNCYHSYSNSCSLCRPLRSFDDLTIHFHFCQSSASLTPAVIPVPILLLFP